MPKKIDPAVKERALRMVAEHRGGYASLTAFCDQVGRRLGLGKETVRRWALQADIDAGTRPGVSTEESPEIKRLKGENRGLSICACGSHWLLRLGATVIAAQSRW